jgi:hypothetical protein
VFFLDVVNDGTNTTPCLAPAGGFSGQNWRLTPRPDATYRLVNDFTGPDSSLGTDAGTDDPVLGPGDHSGQHRTLTRLGQVPGTVPIPDLAARPGLNIAEGPTDFARFARPRGVVKAIMIFVDFPDAHAGPASADAIGKHLLGQGQAQQLFHDQSYGQLTLDVTVRSDVLPSRSRAIVAMALILPYSHDILGGLLPATGPSMASAGISRVVVLSHLT